MRRVLAFLALLILFVLPASGGGTGDFLIPSAGAEITAFATGWENQEPLGFENRVEYSKDVAGYFNSLSPPPEAGPRYRETYHGGDNALMMAGYSRSSYAYCYYRIFDLTLKIEQGMKIGYWIYHAEGTAKIAVDGHFSDGGTLRDFYSNGYLTDQSGVRIHPASRQEPMKQWSYVEVDLSRAEGKTLSFIMFAFDNGSDGFKGRYRTYVDDFKIVKPGIDVASLTGGLPRGKFGSGEQTDLITEPETWRWSEYFYGFQGIDSIAWMTTCGEQHNYVIGLHQNDLVEYAMKFGGEYGRLVLKGLASQPGPVEMEIFIDGQSKARAAWENNNGCNQDTAIEIPGIAYGTHAIAVKFVNDSYNASTGQDRNFYLDGLRVERSLTPPPAPPPPPEPPAPPDPPVPPPPTPPPTPPSGKSKLTLHTSFMGGESMVFIREVKPPVVKILDNLAAASDVKRVSPNTKIVGRIYFDPWQQMGVGSPEDRATDWWNAVKGSVLAHPDVDYWEGYNEPGINDAVRMSWYSRFEKKRVELLAQSGRKACIGNFSMGVPPVEKAVWEAFYPAIDAAIANGGVMGLHEYSAPTMDYLFDYNAGEGWLTGRYRKVYRQFLSPAGREIPLVITECGIDGGGGGGWKNYQSAENYVQQLKWYDSLLKEDRYVLGATIFAIEIFNWDSFDIRGEVLSRLIEYAR